MPTILTATGATAPHGRELDGVSLIEHLKSGGSKSLGRDAIYWHFPHYRHAPGPYSIIRAGDWKLIKFYEGPTFELFDLGNDLSEKNNLAGSMADKVKALDQQLMAHLESVGARVPRNNPNHKIKSGRKKGVRD